MANNDSSLSNVRNLRPPRPPIDGGGDGGDNGDMEIQRRLTAIEALLPTLATKADVDGVRLSTKADAADMRADLHKMDASIKTWMIATIIGLFFGFAGLFFAMSSSLKPPAATSQQSPIIINVPAATAPAATAPQK